MHYPGRQLVSEVIIKHTTTARHERTLAAEGITTFWARRHCRYHRWYVRPLRRVDKGGRLLIGEHGRLSVNSRRETIDNVKLCTYTSAHFVGTPGGPPVNALKRVRGSNGAKVVNCCGSLVTGAPSVGGRVRRQKRSRLAGRRHAPVVPPTTATGGLAFLCSLKSSPGARVAAVGAGVDLVECAKMLG